MSILTYLAIALIALETDALCCGATDQPFRFGRALVLAALWPLTAPLVIAGVLKAQNAKLIGAEGVRAKRLERIVIKRFWI